MAPHMHDSTDSSTDSTRLSHLSNMSQPTKPAHAAPRIRPAIPLVFARSKPSAPVQDQSHPPGKDAKGAAVAQKPPSSSSLPPPATEDTAAPLPDAPLTPDSGPSTQAIAGIVTPPDTLSDPNLESEDSKASNTDTPASSYAPFSPSAVTMEAPVMLPPQYPIPHHTSPHSQLVTGPFPVMHHVADENTTHHGLANGHHSRQRSEQHSGADNVLRASHGESVPAPYRPSHNVSVTTGPIHHPPHNGGRHERGMGYISPPAITSPTSWNPAANFFVPPSVSNVNVPISNGHGLSRSGSHSSSGPEIPPLMGPVALPGQLYLPLPLDTVALGNYMISQFSNREFADISLHVMEPGSNSSLQGFPVHAVVIARSPTLHWLLRTQTVEATQPLDGLRALTIKTASKFVRRSSILEAVGYLYGIPLQPIEDNPTENHLRHPTSVSMAALDRALSLAGAGVFLKLPDIVNHALGYVVTKLSWESLDKTLAFVHESLESLEILTSRAEQDLKHSLSLSVTNLFLYLEKFIVEQFPKGFEFHASAPALSISRRLPALQESRPSVSDPRLASIQFGAMPTEHSMHLELGNLLSSILLTVPTTLLQHLLISPILGERLGWSKLRDLIREVVEERERRRLKIIKTRRVLPGATPQQWEEANWEECLEASPDLPSGLLLSRSRREITSPS